MVDFPSDVLAKTADASRFVIGLLLVRLKQFDRVSGRVIEDDL
jgi:hypothetical protein